MTKNEFAKVVARRYQMTNDTTKAWVEAIFGTLGEILTEKSGNLNLGVEGIMFMGGVAGLAGAYILKSQYYLYIFFQIVIVVADFLQVLFLLCTPVCYILE